MGCADREGAGWRQAIQKELDAARCVLVAWSKRSVSPAGEFVHDEAMRAKRRGAYLPVLIDHVDPPLGFGEMMALPLMGWKGNRDDSRYKAVLATARKVVEGERPALPPPTMGPPVSRRVLVGGGVALGATTMAGGAWYLFRPRPAAAAQKALAVLPFEALSRREEDSWLAEGIAEEVRTALSRIDSLRVMARKTSQELQKADDTLALAR